MLLYERFSTFTESLLYEHSFDRFVGVVFLAVFFTFHSFHSVCCIIPIHFVDEGITKRVAHGSCCHTPIVIAYYMINVLYSFERGSELEYNSVFLLPSPLALPSDHASLVKFSACDPY